MAEIKHCDHVHLGRTGLQVRVHHQGKEGQELKPVACSAAETVEETVEECCFLEFSVF